MTSSNPDISVIIPVYYSTLTLGQCLSALESQSFRNFEVILVDSSREFKTRQIVKACALDIVFIQTKNRLLPHAARNIGLKKARGELIVFTDPDCIMNPEWLEVLWRLYKKKSCIYTGGMDHDPGNHLAMGIHLCKYHRYLPGLPPSPKWIAPTSNAAYPKRMLEKIGIFDGTIFAGDALLSWKAHARGIEIRFEPRAKVTHIHLETCPAFLRQRYMRGIEFARTRMAFESWHPLRTAATFLLFPWLPLLVMFRAWRDCRHSGNSVHFWSTVHVQWPGHFFWSLGEAHAQWKILTHQIRLPEIR